MSSGQMDGYAQPNAAPQAGLKQYLRYARRTLKFPGTILVRWCW